MPASTPSASGSRPSVTSMSGGMILPMSAPRSLRNSTPWSLTDIGTSPRYKSSRMALSDSSSPAAAITMMAARPQFSFPVPTAQISSVRKSRSVRHSSAATSRPSLSFSAICISRLRYSSAGTS